MKIIEPKYEILTDISDGGIKELQQIELPDGAIIEGKVDSWTDYGDELLQITIDGTTYLVHAADAVMKT